MPREQLGRQTPFAVRRARHERAADDRGRRAPSERHLRVRLPQRPDQRVARIAERTRGVGMQARDQLGGVALDALG